MTVLKNANYAYTTLNEDITDTDVELVVASDGDAAFPTTGYFVGAIWSVDYSSPAQDPDRELVLATYTTTDTFTIERAYEDTTAKSWSAGDNFALVFTAGKMDNLELDIQTQALSYATATGTNSYVAVMDPIVTEYSTGSVFHIIFTNASTDSCTLQLNSLAALPIYIYNPEDSSFELAGAGDIAAGMFSSVACIGGTYWILLHAVHDWSTYISDAIDTAIDAAVELESGTSMLFNQASAPTNWTKDTGWTNSSIVVGDTYGSGGSDDPTSWETSISVATHGTHTHAGGAHTHTGASHVHGWYVHETSPTNDYVFDSDGNGIPIVNTTESANHDGIVVQNNANTLLSCYTSGAVNVGVTGSSSATTGATSAGSHTVTQATYEPLYQIMITATKD